MAFCYEAAGGVWQWHVSTCKMGWQIYISFNFLKGRKWHFIILDPNSLKTFLLEEFPGPLCYACERVWGRGRKALRFALAFQLYVVELIKWACLVPPTSTCLAWMKSLSHWAKAFEGHWTLNVNQVLLKTSSK